MNVALQLETLSRAWFSARHTRMERNSSQQPTVVSSVHARMDVTPALLCVHKSSDRRRPHTAVTPSWLQSTVDAVVSGSVHISTVLSDPTTIFVSTALHNSCPEDQSIIIYYYNRLLISLLILAPVPNIHSAQTYKFMF